MVKVYFLTNFTGVTKVSIIPTFLSHLQKHFVDLRKLLKPAVSPFSYTC